MSPIPSTRPQQTPASKSGQGKKNNTGSVVAIVFIAAIALGVIAYFVYPKIQGMLQKTPEPIIVEELPEMEEIIPEELIVEDIKPAKIESTSSVPKGFYIIVGSYRVKNNADVLVKNIRKDIEAEVLYFPELGLYRVSTGKYDNIHKAYNDMFSIKDLDGCANAWVLENQ